MHGLESAVARHSRRVRERGWAPIVVAPRVDSATPVIRSVHAIGSPRLGGAERFFVRLVGALERGGNPTVAVIRTGSELGEILDANQARVETGMRNGLDLLTMMAIRRVVRDSGADVIQTYLGRASRLTRLPRRSRTLHVARLGGFYRFSSYRHADAWVGNTQGICDYLVRGGFPAHRVFHISNFVEPAKPVVGSRPARLPGGLALPEGARLVFALGRLVERKGFGDLLDAFAGLPESWEDRPLHLVVAGDGPERAALARQAEELGIEARVHLPGWIREPAPLYRFAIVFVCPSRHEPLGNVVLEAWAEGAPVVATRTQGPVELIDPGETGLLVDVASPDDLRAGVLEMLRAGPAERNRVVENARVVVRARHSLEAIVSQYLSLYARLLGAE